MNPKGEHYANLWQGDFPNHNSAEDGYIKTSPVRKGKMERCCSNWCVLRCIIFQVREDVGDCEPLSQNWKQFYHGANAYIIYRKLKVLEIRAHFGS